MKAIIGIVIIGVLVDAAGTADPRNVNIALETIVRYDKKDQTPGLSIIDKVGDALEKLKDKLLFRRNINTDAGTRRNNPHDMTFTDFMSKAAKILNDFDDSDLEDVFAVIHDESRRYITRESMLQDIFGSSDVRRHLTEQLDMFGDVSAKKLRRHLNTAIAAIEHKQRTGEKNDILDIGNLLYIGAAAKFRSALINLERLQKTKDAHIEVVLRDTLRSLIFDHYSNLNDKIKRELIEMAKDYWRMYSIKHFKTTRISGLKTITVSHFSHKGRNKNDHKNRLRLLKAQMSHEYGNKYPHRSHKNKRYTIKLIKPKDLQFTPDTSLKNEIYTVKLKKPKDKKITSASTKLIKFNSGSTTSFEIKKTPPKIIELNKMTPSENSERFKEINLKVKKYTSPKNKISPAHSYENTILKESKTNSAQSDINSSMILIGGQKMGHIYNIGLRSRALLPEKKEDEIDTSEDTSEQQLTTHKSVVKFTTEHSAADDEDDITTGNKFSVTTAGLRDVGISGEGLSIESFEDESTIKNKIMRRSNSKHPETTILKEIIQSIERQIKDVKEQVSYVKNISVCTDKPNNPILKSVQSDETSTTLFKTKNNRHRAPDSDAIDRENEAFFNRYVLEHIATETTAADFSANNDADNKVTVTDKNKNITKTTASENKIVKTTAILNETKAVTLNTSTIKNYTEQIRNTTQTDLNTNNKTDNINDESEAKDAKKINVEKDDIRLNEIVSNTTALEEKYEENYVSTPQTLNFNFSTKYELDDDHLFGNISQSVENTDQY